MAQECYDPWSNTRAKNGLEADLVISAMQKYIRRVEGETALRMAYKLYTTSTFHEGKMWSRLSMVSVEDVGFEDTQAPVFVKTMYNLHKECPCMDGDRPIFFAHTIRYICRCQKEYSADRIKNTIMKEFGTGYVPEIPEYAIDMHTIKGRAMGKGVFYFLDEVSKVQPLWDEYNGSYCLELYEVCKGEAEQKREDK